MERKPRKIKVNTIFGILFIIAVLVLNFAGCAKKVSDFTEEEHIKRISERVEKRFITEDKKYTDFSVYPLYDLDEELILFLVEFEPYGFMFVRVSDEHFLSCIGLGRMYLDGGVRGQWSPFTIDEERHWEYEVDENGKRIVYKRSPYYIADCLNERKYLWDGGKDGYIFAIKKDDDTFINLVSSTEMSISNGDLNKRQAGLSIVFDPHLSTI